MAERGSRRAPIDNERAEARWWDPRVRGSLGRRLTEVTFIIGGSGIMLETVANRILDANRDPYVAALAEKLKPTIDTKIDEAKGPIDAAANTAVIQATDANGMVRDVYCRMDNVFGDLEESGLPIDDEPLSPEYQQMCDELRRAARESQGAAPAEPVEVEPNFAGQPPDEAAAPTTSTP